MISRMSSRSGSIMLFLFFEWRMDMNNKGAKAVSIIGGADGPTSVFMVGRTGKKALKDRVRNYIYKCKRKRMENKIHAGGHTLKEVVAYANERFNVTEILEEEKKYIEQRKCLKESLILKHKPELLGDMKDIKKPTVWNEDSVREFHQQLQIRSEIIAEIPDNKMPMDFHIYEIKTENGWLEMEIDYMWDIFGMSYSASKKSMKQLKKIAKELYIYYGVTEEDIKLKSKRYSLLLTTLCS